MNINELETFDLAAAVKFHKRLNPRLWGSNEHLLPDVRDRLLATAADFKEFLGVADIDVEDITISGSNAAFSYTPGSDIDLHLVVRMPTQNAEVYQELFNAKKYQYNDEHDIRIGGADVELYVQPADQAHHSQGIYSVQNSKWLQVPRRRKIDIDDHCVKHKTQDLESRIDQAIDQGTVPLLDRLWTKIKNMRQTGLETTGEFGCDNLVFKMLRRSGHLQRLKQSLLAAKDRELSLQERKKKKTKTRKTFGGWYPGFGYGGGDGGGGESMREGHQGQPYSSPDGVAATTQMFLNETDADEQMLQDFITHTAEQLGIERMPQITFHRDDDWGVDNHSFGRYDPEQHELHVNLAGRHIMDILRTTAHELAHCRQHELSPLPDNAGDTGSPWENQAHATAGVIMRHWADRHPELFDSDTLEEATGYIPKNKKEAHDPRFSMAITQDIQPGQVGREANKLALKTGRNGEPGLLMRTANLREGRVRDLNDPPGPESPPTMPRGTVRVDVSDMYDWYKLGQHISNMKGLGRHDFGQGPPSSIISFGDEETEHKFIQDLEATGLDITDIDPRDPQQPPGMRKIKTDPTYNVAEVKDFFAGSKFGDDSGNTFSVEQIIAFARQNPKYFHKDFPLSKIAHDLSWWQGNRERMMNADTSYPLLVIQNDDGHLSVADGLNRMKKAIDVENKKTIDVFVVPKKDIMQFAEPPPVAEAFDQPYQLKWEKGEHGDWDALATLADGTYLSIMFNNEFKNNWMVEFHRNNSQQVTGEGDAQRIFATVLTAIEKFIQKKKPASLFFSAVKEDDPKGSRARLYTTLVNRYATKLGYSVTTRNDDRGMSFKLTRMTTKAVAEDDLVESLRREFELLEDEMLGEIRMSPTNLRAEAARTGALAGMEFEMIVPEVSGGDDDHPEFVQDYSHNPRTRSISDIVEFFNDGDYNSRREVSRLEHDLITGWAEWMDEQFEDRWEVDKTLMVYEFVRYELDPEITAEILGFDADNRPDGFSRAQLAQVTDIIADDPQNAWHDEAKDYARESFQENADQSDWLDEEGMEHMSDVVDRYDIQWPYWEQEETDSAGMDIDSVAQDFGDAVGRPVNASRSYHGGRREPGKYVVEPDGSLEPNNRVIVGADGNQYKTYLNQSGRAEIDDQFLNRWQSRMKKQDPDYVDQDYRVVEYNESETGLEFVSPPLPIDKLFDDLKKVQAWAKKNKITSNASTGLHINVSVPEFDIDKLDYVKLALLLGDEYVLDQFGRSSNTYARSAMSIVRDRVRSNPETAKSLLDRMRGHMEDLATKAIHSGDTSKYTSINTKTGYIEFRSPGGDWLDENFDKIETTLLRFTVALKAAMDPDAYREEYLKKLYKLLEPTAVEGAGDTIRYFADYVAGKIPQTALRSFVKQARLKRDIARGKGKGLQYWWRVYKDGKDSPNTPMIEVVAVDKKEAIDRAGAEWGVFSQEYKSRMDAEPVRPYKEGQDQPATDSTAPMLNGRPSNPDGNTYIAAASDPDTPLYRYMAAGTADAQLVLDQWKAQYGDNFVWRPDHLQLRGQPRVAQAPDTASNVPPGQTDYENRLGWPDQTGDANYEVVDRSNYRPVFLMVANTVQDAARKYEQWLNMMGLPDDTEDYGFRERARPGSTLDIQRRRADQLSPLELARQQTAQNMAQTGSTMGSVQWRILIDGEEIHRFWNRPNQGEANAAAIAWVQDQIRRGLLSPEQGAEVEVVPLTTNQT